MPLTDLRLDTPRLVLRELSDADAPAILRYASDPEVVRFVAFGPSGPAEVDAFLRRCAEGRWASPRRVFELALTLRSTGALIGAGGVRIQSDDGVGDLGYMLHRDAWGQGLGTEACRALVHLGLSVLGLHRLWATCHVENAASARVLEKAGFTREGRLRQNVLQRGAWRDSYLYAIVAGDPRGPTSPPPPGRT